MECTYKVPQSVTDPAEIDLTRHALIEASAGTGKTFTIENLVVRLIVERRDLAIENILLVTFTEKAASELKVRIREKIAQQYDQQNDRASGAGRRLRDALDAFDQASVFTIHGFCQNLLSELAFENNALFECELTDDQAIYVSLLKEEMRKGWPFGYKMHLPELLQLCGFAAEKERLLEKIVQLSRTYCPQAGDRIIPQSPSPTFDEYLRDLRVKKDDLAKCLAGPPRFSEAYGKLNIHGGTRKNMIQNVILPLEFLLLENPAYETGLTAWSRYFDELKKKRKRMADLAPQKWSKGGPNKHECPHLDAVVAAAVALEQHILAGRHWIVRETAASLKKAVGDLKLQRGWISFEDMLVRVYEALFSESAPLLLERIREKYKIAFVDEFQDTDPVQWRIFRNIFVDRTNAEKCNPLIIIGDPKQAIYSFRGADVYAYLEARSVMSVLASKGQANLYSLSNNWRSMPDLVAGFNRLFSQAQWFSTPTACDDMKISYTDADSPGKEKLPLTVTQDKTGREELNIVDLRSSPSTRHAKKSLGAFIVEEIKQLIASRALWLKKKGHGQRPLDHGDICILVRGRAEVRHLEPDLRAAGIPYSFYKKPGLFQSEEADALSLILHAVIDPGNGGKVKQALLTPFLDANPSFLYAYGEAPVTHPVRQLLLRWNEMAIHRNWRQLFQSLMEESGMTFRLSPRSDWDRVHTNFSQIFEYLESEAYFRNLDFRALLALLDGYRDQTLTADEDANIHQIETEARKVQIMTMHVSKGLQFPVVFIAGGLTQRAQSDYHVFHQTQPDESRGVIRVFDLAKKHSQEHRQEQEDEDRRLLYVALTRAQIKLYLPYFPVLSGHGWVGPISKFVAASLQTAFGDGEDLDPSICLQVEDQYEGIPVSNDADYELDLSVETPPIDFSLPPTDDFRGRKLHLDSYSSINLAMSHQPTSDGTPAFQPDLMPVKDPDEISDQKTPEKNSRPSEVAADSKLPGGPHVGSMLHDILEQIDYGLVFRDPENILALPRTMRVIERNMALYQVAPEWEEAVADLVVAALTTPIQLNGSRLVLGSLAPRERVHEVAFYFPYLWEIKPLLMQQNRYFYMDCDGYLRGFIDLIFRFEGRYYLADWKSNQLMNGFGPKALKENMDHAGYHLQYRIYTLALLRWLERAYGSVSRAWDLFGGVFYFYLRGMGAGSQEGIYYVPPNEIGTRKGLESELMQVLSQTIK